ncbi:MAG TPA: M48 family peptidase [Methylophaga aminisulfidivorans]|nr:M48 family peptidase [Methylophaga aminisulfidivorans]
MTKTTTSLQLDDISISVIRSKKRKTMALQIRDDQVLLRIPARLPMALANRFIQEKKHWIQQTLANKTPSEKKQFTNGELFRFLDQKLPLNIIFAKRNKVYLENQTLIVETKVSEPSYLQLSKWITNWYRQHANEYLADRFALISKQLDFSPNSLTIKSYKARWGSCAINGAIQLNWKLIMAPVDIIDYVIIHELCHLQHHNHSSQFWGLVTHFYPDYQQARTWLKKHGHTLTID